MKTINLVADLSGGIANEVLAFESSQHAGQAYIDMVNEAYKTSFVGLLDAFLHNTEMAQRTNTDIRAFEVPVIPADFGGDMAEVRNPLIYSKEQEHEYWDYDHWKLDVAADRTELGYHDWVLQSVLEHGINGEQLQ